MPEIFLKLADLEPTPVETEADLVVVLAVPTTMAMEIMEMAGQELTQVIRL
jgi:predicted dinucleotide-binding enzyme